ncbi:hypothetical protein [Cellulomonas alba]|uniref:Fis family transcriptional regulator n=1 Tax=Cellulomonas alba TaxID=3053467 RepID=A0ABT7SCS6_9CELL|nr:hypothetical protein [Cellulomonas alba]MDM7853980.1 hypothetical protein [Cellulomonas alba]
MRWEALFGDLEAQLDATRRADLQAELGERVRAERSSVSVVDRVRAASGARLRVWVAGGLVVEGDAIEVATQWVLLADGVRRVLVPTDALVGMAGLPAIAAPPAGAVERRLSLGHVLRALARDRAAVVVVADGYELGGRLERVGADHVDVTPVGGGAAALRTVPFGALRVVRSG